MSARQIAPKFVPKVWGSRDLAPWFGEVAEKTGEVWFPAGDLLIKFLFTSENLSVQVHPDDTYAREHENSRGKTEMWHILRADPGAQVALGFTDALDAGTARELAQSGGLMDRLAWHAAQPGDTFYTPAGTVHAIGAGLALCEIQQNSDVTYRLFDYGRPRELHLDRALAVARCEPHAGAHAARTLAEGHDELCRCEFFVTERLKIERPARIEGERYAIVLDGAGRLDGQAYEPGTVWELGPGTVAIEPSRQTVLLLAAEPTSPKA